MNEAESASVCAALDRIVASAPALKEQWLRDGWRENNHTGREPYVEVGAVSTFLIQLVADNPASSDLPVVAAAIEAEFDSQSTVLQNWLRIGLIESIQHRASNTHLRGEQPATAGQIKAHLGPLARASWEALDQQWGNSVDDL